VSFQGLKQSLLPVLPIYNQLSTVGMMCVPQRKKVPEHGLHSNDSTAAKWTESCWMDHARFLIPH